MKLGELDSLVEAPNLHSPNDPVHQVGSAALSILRSHPDAVLSLAHEKLHAFHFNEVPTSWRRLYEEATLWKVVFLTKSSGEGWIDEVVKCLDMALILTGAPGRRSLIDSIFESLDTLADQQEDTCQPPPKRRCVFHGDEWRHPTNSKRTTQDTFHSTDKSAEIPVILNPISRIDHPSLSVFQNHAQQQRTPIILTNTLRNWPAVEKWQLPQHWLDHTLGGRRLVPVELGRSYTDDGWTQKIIPFGEFLETHLLGGVENDEDSSATQRSSKGYLAQHDLLTQVPKLRSEIMIPDYCYIDSPKPELNKAGMNGSTSIDEVSEDEFVEPLLNIWLGPAGTISPCHTDPHHNILAQVVGRKYVRLFSPTESRKLYPMDGGKGEVDNSSLNTKDDEKAGAQTEQTMNMSNTSRIDVSQFLEYEGKLDDDREEQRATLKLFPLFEGADFVDCILDPGECLYIPRGWWHFITSLDVSASVSFWWD